MRTCWTGPQPPRGRLAWGSPSPWGSLCPLQEGQLWLDQPRLCREAPGAGWDIQQGLGIEDRV